jgi:hypothetical protein
MCQVMDERTLNGWTLKMPAVPQGTIPAQSIALAGVSEKFSFVEDCVKAADCANRFDHMSSAAAR